MESVSNIQPYGNRILVELVPQETVTPSGIILSPGNKAKQNKAKIVSIGSGIKMKDDGSWLPSPFYVGDLVLLVKYAGIEVGDDHLIVMHEDIVALIKE